MLNQLICLEPSCQLDRVIVNPNQISLHTKEKHQCVEISDLKEKFSRIANVNLDQGKTTQILIEEIMQPFIDQLRDALRSHILYYLQNAIPNFKVLSLISKFQIDPHFDFRTLSNEDFQNFSRMYNDNIRIDFKQTFQQGLKDISQKQKEFCQLFQQNLKPIFIDNYPVESEITQLINNQNQQLEVAKKVNQPLPSKGIKILNQSEQFKIPQQPENYITPTQQPESPKQTNSGDQDSKCSQSAFINILMDEQQIKPSNICLLRKFETSNELIKYTKNSTQVQYKGVEQQICLVEGKLNEDCRIKFQLQKPHFAVGIIDLSKNSAENNQSLLGKYQIELDGKLITDNEILDTELILIQGGIVELEWKYSTQLLSIKGKKKKSYQYKIPFDDTSNLRIAVWLKEGGQIEILKD